MMTGLLVTVIVVYHSILRWIGMALGLLTAGIWVGFKQGAQNVDDMFKFLEYKAKHDQAKKKVKEKEDAGSGPPESMDKD